MKNDPLNTNIPYMSMFEHKAPFINKNAVVIPMHDPWKLRQDLLIIVNSTNFPNKKCCAQHKPYDEQERKY